MKTSAILTVILSILISTAAHADKVTGRLIYKSDTTYFKYEKRGVSNEYKWHMHTLGSMQFKMKIITDKGEELKLTPKDSVLEIHVFFDTDTARLLKCPKPSGAGGTFNSYEHMFMHLIVEGDVNLVQYYTNSPENGLQMHPYYLKSGEKPYLIKKGGFRRRMTKYFSDCPSLVQKIDEKNYNFWFMEDIAKFYNQECK